MLQILGNINKSFKGDQKFNVSTLQDFSSFDHDCWVSSLLAATTLELPSVSMMG